MGKLMKKFVIVMAFERGRRQLRQEAAQMLQERMGTQREYEEAMRRFLSKPPFKSSGARYPTRDELYEDEP